MTLRVETVPVCGGELAVIDYGGVGPAALLIHSVGFCAVNFQALAVELAGHCHVYALDLRGHGRSTAPLTHSDQLWQDIPLVVRHLRLQRPLLVGHDTGGSHATAATVSDPELARAVVAIGGNVARTAEEVADTIAFARSDHIRHMLAERFLFGRTGQDEKTWQVLVDQLISQARQDWLLSEFAEPLRAEVEWSVRMAADGSWQHLPTVDTVLNAYLIAHDTSMYPDVSLLGRLRTPLWIVLPTNGHDSDLLEQSPERVSPYPQVRVCELHAGQYPQYTRATALAGIIGDIAAQTS